MNGESRGAGTSPAGAAHGGAQSDAASAGNETWTTVGAWDDLLPGSLSTFKHRNHQLVVLRTEAGEVFALDNRCPHEGYPLAQGDLKGCSLTCGRHNWKFDVHDGRCILGGEDVRAYPVRVLDGAIEVDLADPEPSVVIPGLRRSFEQGLFEYDNGRTLRDGVRLLQVGYDPWKLLADLACYDALHAEYGSTHVLAVAADCGRLLERYPGVDAMYAIAPAVDLCGDTNIRMPEREHPLPRPGASCEAIRQAVEEEDAERAEGLLRGAFESGVPRDTLEGWLYAILSDHFLDFGHRLIYLVKAGELLDHVDDAYARDIYPALLYSTALATREDTLPYMRRYFEGMREVEPEFPRILEHERSDADFDPAAVRDAVLDGKASDAFDAVWNALRGGTPAPEIARALVGAAAHRLYRFDISWDADPDVAENWLWATHRFTFASAVRNATLRFRSPDSLRFLFQAVAFIHSGRRMDAPPERRIRLPQEGSPSQVDAGRILEAIGSHETEAAVRLSSACLRQNGSVAELRHALEDLCIADPLVRPIVVAHAIKTTVAAFEEYEALAGQPDRDMTLLSAIRFLASPVVERRVKQTVRTSLRWVVNGTIPRKLTQ
ncbi:MAG: Rieske 2Fe-2S domain-containing protein [Candidatus Krumholzibacteriia bacterium]